MVLRVRIAKAELSAMNAEEELFAGCFTIGTLVDKFAFVTQDNWFRYTVERPHKAECTALEEWLEIKRKVAVKHRMKRGKADVKKAAEDVQAIKSASYSIRADMDWDLFPASKNKYKFILKIDEVKTSTRLTSCAGIYKKIKQVEQGYLLKEVRGCRQCMSWIHSANTCHQHKKRRGEGVVPWVIRDAQNTCGREHHPHCPRAV